MDVLGLDIGGANLKAAHTNGKALTLPFELWKSPTKLHRELQKIVKRFPKFDRVGVTMTGELCDCFLTKREGVNAILDQVLMVFKEKEVLVWLVDEGFQNVARAREMHQRTAASNWHVLASYCGKLSPQGINMLVDTGSTTTDIIPIVNGKPASKGKTDAERLEYGELVYMGVDRTPAAMISAFFECREFFATVLDCYIVLGDIPEQPENRNTADGRPATKEFSRNRLARMIGGDSETVPLRRIERYAFDIYMGQGEKLYYGISAVAKRLRRKVTKTYLSGAGEFLLRMLWEDPNFGRILPKTELVSFNEILGAERSKAACAWALTQMMEE